MNTARMPWEFELKRMFGFKSHLPVEGVRSITRNLAAEQPNTAPRIIDFEVLTAADADVLSARGKKHRPGRGRPRVFAQCDFVGCGRWISAGRFNQHYRLAHFPVFVEHLKPYALVRGKEIISMPWIENGQRVYVMLRNIPGDPTSMVKAELFHGALICPKAEGAE